MPSPLIQKLHSYSDITSQLYKSTFLTTHLIAVLQLSEYSIFHGGDTSFNSVFHNRVTPISVLILKPLLGVIGAIPLKP